MEQEATNDEALVTAARGGDTEAFGHLVDRYQGVVWAAAISTVADPELAEDVAQETFVAAWRGLGSLRDAGRLRSWLVGIARNTARNVQRTRHREVLSDEIEREGHVQSPVDDALATEQSQSLWKALEDVPEQYRVPLVLFYREEQSVQQVATDLGLTEGAVKKRLSRGREFMRAGMERTLAAEARRMAPRRALAPLVLAAIAALPARKAAAASVGLALFAKGMTMKGIAKGGAVLVLLLLLIVGGKNLLADSESAENSVEARAQTSQRGPGPINARFQRSETVDTAKPAPNDAELGGVVVDEEGQPVAGATVMFRIDPRHGTDSRHEPATTDGLGRFRIGELRRSAALHLSATATGYLPTSHYDTVPEGQEVRLVLRRGGLTMNGTVSDIGGGGIPGATVRYYHLSSGALAAMDRPALATVTDGTGRYQVSLAAGKYIVAADHADYAGEIRGTTLTLDGVAEDFVLSPGATVEGVVRGRGDGQPVPFATIQAMVMGDWDGNAIASILVTGGQQRMFTATADAKGRYRLDGLPAERLALTAGTAHAVSRDVQNVDLGIADRRTEQTLWVHAGFRVRGIVVEATNGEPVPGIGISAGSDTSMGFGNAEPTLTDSSGRFETILPQGHYQLMAVGDGYEFSVEGPSIEVKNADIEGLRLEVRKGASLTGRLDPPEMGMLMLAPANKSAGFDITGLFTALMTQGRVAEDGSFELRGAPTGDFNLVATTTSGRKGSVKLSIKGDTSGILIETETDESVEGKLVDTEGAPVVGASVRLVHPRVGDALGVDTMLDEILGAGSRTDANGAFRIPLTSRGTLKAAVKDSYGHAMRIANGATVEVRNKNAMHSVTIEVEGNHSVIRGRVLSADGSPVADALVRSPTLRTGALSNADGEFEIAHVPSKTFDLTVRHAASGESGHIESAKPGDFVTVRLKAPASLTVQVPNAAAGLMATITSGDTDLGELVRTGENTWHIERLAPGTYNVEVVGAKGGAGGRIEVEAGEHAQVTFDFHRWARLRGHAMTSDGEPASRVFFTMSRDEDMIEHLTGHELYMLMRARVDSDGYFDVPIANGAGTLILTSADGVAAVAVSPLPGEVIELGDVTLEAVN